MGSDTGRAEMRAAKERGQDLGFTDDELAFYDALEVNDSAVAVLGDATLRLIAYELVAAVQKALGSTGPSRSPCARKSA